MEIRLYLTWCKMWENSMEIRLYLTWCKCKQKLTTMRIYYSPVVNKYTRTDAN
jgi:hypothetical protein